MNECQRCGAGCARYFCKSCNKILNAQIRRWAGGGKELPGKELQESLGLTQDDFHSRISRMGLAGDAHRKSMVGFKSGRLTVVAQAPSQHKGGHLVRMWRCECSCGGVAAVPTSKLTNRDTRSCGCLKREWASGLNARKRA